MDHQTLGILLIIIAVLSFVATNIALTPSRKVPPPAMPSKLHASIVRGCPDCGESPIWKMGGGMAYNIQCGHCGAEFNVTDFDWAEGIKR